MNYPGQVLQKFFKFYVFVHDFVKFFELVSRLVEEKYNTLPVRMPSHERDTISQAEIKTDIIFNNTNMHQWRQEAMELPPYLEENVEGFQTFETVPVETLPKHVEVMTKRCSLETNSSDSLGTFLS